MTDNVPDFDSMTPEEMMAWMEALAKRQGATEGLVTSGDVDVPEIDPDSVAIDEPGYIPFGMDPDVWAQKKAEEDRIRSERIAAMKAEKGQTPTAPVEAPQPPEPVKAEEPSPVLDELEAEEEAGVTNPLEFLSEVSATPEAPSFDEVVSELSEVSEAEFEMDLQAEAQEDASLEDMFEELGTALPMAGGEMDWLANLGQAAADLPGLDTLDLGSLEALDQPAAEQPANALEWLESLVGGDEPPAEAQAEISMDDMLIEDEPVEEESSVSAVLNDPMEWLADYTDNEPMSDQVKRVTGEYSVEEEESPVEVPVDEELAAFFDRVQQNEGIALPEDAGDAEHDLLPLGEVTDIEDGMSDEISSALNTGEEVPAEEMQAWMTSMLDRGIQRTDVVDEDFDEEEPLVAGELPAWLVEQVGQPPSTEELLAAEGDLPDWLTAPVSEEQSAEFEEIFKQIAESPSEQEDALEMIELPENIQPLDTGAIRVQMDDPWVEAFELEREERLTDTGRLAAWYDSAAHEVRVATDSQQVQAEEAAEGEEAVPAAPEAVTLEPAQLSGDEELPPGELQSVPDWLADVEAAAPAAAPVESTTEARRDSEPIPLVASDEELPDWLRQAQIQSDEVAEVPTWLTDSLSTDEFAQLQLDEEDEEQALATAPSAEEIAAAQDEPTTPIPAVAGPITQRRTVELPQYAKERPAREAIPVSEAAALVNQARASLKLGDVNAMLDTYERLIRAEVALTEVETDMEKVAKDVVHKSNPSVLRVYGDALLRLGKLQQALDTYRAALNLL